MNEIAVAAVAGAAAWFLVIWPIIWSPVLVPHPLHFPFVAVLMAFWVAFVLLPPAGVVVSDFMGTSISGRAPEWQAQYVWAFLTLPAGVVVNLVVKISSRRLRFSDDPVPEVAPDDDWERGRWDRMRWRFEDPPTGWVIVAMFVVLVWQGRRARRH